MPNYCVNINAQPNGDHEVHDTDSCTHLPLMQHRLGLGWYASCGGAVLQAKKTYAQSNGCYYCSPSCNTG